MRYYQQPDQDFGGGGMDADPEQQPTRQPRTAQRAPRPAQPAAQQAPAAPQTFAQMQRAGMARPPMPMMRNLGMARLSPRLNPMMPPPAMQTARLSPRLQPMNNPIQTATLSPRVNPIPPGMGGSSLVMAPQESAETADPNGIITTTAPAAAGGPPPNAFDPMEWFRQQVMGGSQNVLDRSLDYLGGQIDDEFSQRERSLRSEMASRGLADSTVYGGRMADLNVGRRSAKADLAERLALQDLERRQSMVDRMVGMDADQRNYLLQLLGFGYGG